MTKSNDTQWRVALLGGFRRDGKWTPRRHTVTVPPIGGADIDLTEAVLPGDELTITKVSAHRRRQADRARGHERRGSRFSLLGGRKLDRAPKGAGPTVQLNAYGVVGGVQVRRTSR
ncbi:hypothetical protein [Sphaerisporangium perillae]|uniref:hypothetical protein n=1 Tax=Sphaerisporangium perillae TaxID=2935860 RepID=UPI00200F1133|nr:hypothetical protein [Sphaerisporangium perillae]